MCYNVVRGLFYIVGKNIFADLWFVYVFSHSVALFFTLLTDENDIFPPSNSFYINVKNQLGIFRSISGISIPFHQSVFITPTISLCRDYCTYIVCLNIE